MIVLSRQQEMKDRLIAFLFGDGFVTLYLWIAGIMGDLARFGLGVVGTMIIGGAGGIAAMVAKDLYPHLKKFIKRKFKKKPKPPNDE